MDSSHMNSGKPNNNNMDGSVDSIDANESTDSIVEIEIRSGSNTQNNSPCITPDMLPASPLNTIDIPPLALPIAMDVNRENKINQINIVHPLIDHIVKPIHRNSIDPPGLPFAIPTPSIVPNNLYADTDASPSSTTATGFPLFTDRSNASNSTAPDIPDIITLTNAIQNSDSQETLDPDDYPTERRSIVELAPKFAQVFDLPVDEQSSSSSYDPDEFNEELKKIAERRAIRLQQMGTNLTHFDSTRTLSRSTATSSVNPSPSIKNYIPGLHRKSSVNVTNVANVANSANVGPAKINPDQPGPMKNKKPRRRINPYIRYAISNFKKEKSWISPKTKQRLITASKFAFELYRAFIGSMLSLFVEQYCYKYSQTCSITQTYEAMHPYNMFVLAWNVATFVAYLSLDAIKYHREQYFINECDYEFNYLCKTDEHISHFVDKHLSDKYKGLDTKGRNLLDQINRLNYNYFISIVVAVAFFILNFIFSSIRVFLFYYNGFRTITSLLTNTFLLMIKLYNSAEIFQNLTDLLLTTALSGYKQSPVEYKTVCKKIIDEQILGMSNDMLDQFRETSSPPAPLGGYASHVHLHKIKPATQ